MQLHVNGIVYQLSDGEELETYPVHSYKIKETKIEIKWQPCGAMQELLSKAKKQDNKASIEWKEGEPTPSILMTQAGPPVECKLVCDGKVIHDYGNKIYVGRGSCEVVDDSRVRPIECNEFYVGDVSANGGFEFRFVKFSYDSTSGTLTPCGRVGYDEDDGGVSNDEVSDNDANNISDNVVDNADD